MQEVGRAASLARYRNKKSLVDQSFPLRPKESVKLLTGHIGLTYLSSEDHECDFKERK